MRAHQGGVLVEGDVTYSRVYSIGVSVIVSTILSVAQVVKAWQCQPLVTGTIPSWRQKLNLRVLVVGVHQHSLPNSDVPRFKDVQHQRGNGFQERRHDETGHDNQHGAVQRVY